MASTILTHAYTSTFDLTDQYTTISTTGVIDVVNEVGIYGASGQQWSVTNYGAVQATGTSVSAIFLLDGGSVTNGRAGLASALVSGSVVITGGPGTVTNYGSIAVAGTVSQAVILLGGGLVRNLGSIQATRYGVFDDGQPATVTNYGTIEGTGVGNPGGTGIDLGAGGGVRNFGTILSAGENGFGVNLGTAGGNVYNTGLISGYHIGVFASTASGAGTVVNLGTIQSTQTAAPITFVGEGILLESGGSVANGSTADSSALISAAHGNAISIEGTAGESGTVTNFGTLENAGANADVYSKNGGAITNTATGLISALAGSGVSLGSGGMGTIANLGTIISTGTFNNGVFVGGGGSVTNGATNSTAALIDGLWTGVDFKTVSGAVHNFGTIESTATFSDPGSLAGVTGTLVGVGVILQQGGLVINGTAGSTAGVIDGYALGVYIGGGAGIPNAGAIGTVVNYGTIESTGTGGVHAPAVELSSGGTITNFGMISSAGSDGVEVKDTVAAVVNFGTIQSTSVGTAGQAIYLKAGGTITNYALIEGARPPVTASYAGVIAAAYDYATIRNLGTIAAINISNAINLLHGGTIVNGSTAATEATITGKQSGIYAGGRAHTAYASGAAAFITNYGTIRSTGTGSVIRLVDGGIVTNEATGLISAYAHGVSTADAPATVVNYGTIANTGNQGAVYLGDGGTVTNGSSAKATATIASALRNGIGVENAAATVANFATIISAAPVTGTAGAGVYLQDGGAITNEASGVISAARTGVVLGGSVATSGVTTLTNFGEITGSAGVAIQPLDAGANTILNYGTITGTDGAAVTLTGTATTLVIEPNSMLRGAVAGFAPGDTIDLTGIVFDSGGTATLASGNQLQITEGGSAYSLQLDPSQHFSGQTFRLGSDGNTGTDITIGESPPSITAPASVAVDIDTASPVSGISVADPGVTPGETFTVTLVDASGTLAATGTGVIGSGTTQLTITGSLSAVDSALSGVTDTATAAGADTITLNAGDSLGNAATPQTVAVTATGLPVIQAPTSAVTGEGQATAISGINLAETGATAEETFTVTVSDADGVLSANTAVNGGGGTITPSNGGTTLTVSGSLTQADADLTTLADTEPAAGSDTITVNARDSLGNAAGYDPITYTEQATATGSLDGVDFTNASVLLTLVTSTTNVTGGSTLFDNVGTATVSINGGLSATFTDPTEVFSNQSTLSVGFEDVISDDILDDSSPYFTTYALSTSIGPITGAGSGLNQNSFPTTAGAFHLSSVTTSTFKATVSGPVSAPATIALTVNGLPSITVPGGMTVRQNQPTAITGISVAEGGNTTSSGETFTVALGDTNGVMSANTGANGGGGTITPSNGGTTLTVSGSLTQVNADLTTLADDDPTAGSDTISVNAGDSFGNNANPQTVTTTVLIVPAITSVSWDNATQQVVISGAGFGSQSPYNGDSPYLIIEDGPNDTGFTAGYEGPGEADAVTLNVTRWTDNEIVISGFTGAYGAGSWVFQPGDPVLIGVSNPSGPAPQNHAAFTATFSSTVPSDTSRPTQTIDAAYSGLENTLVPLGGLSVSVGPNGGDPLTTTLSVANGTLSAGGQSGASITLSGTAAQIDGALASASYTGAPNYGGTDTLSMTTSDTLDSASVSSAATITIVAPPPAPSRLALDPSTDSGGQGDGTTDFTQPEIDGQGQAGDTIDMFDGNTPVGTGTVGDNGAWQITTSALALGQHSLTATGTDQYGDTSAASAPLDLTIVSPPPPPGPGAVLINGLGGPDGFGTQSLPLGDDNSSDAIDITAVFPGGLDLFGTTYNQIYINNNGNITFEAPLGTYTPSAIGAGFTSPIIAPFWADVDTRGGPTTPTGGNSTGSDMVWYDLDTADQTLTITWDDVGYFADGTDKADAFQLQLIGEGSGNFEFKFIYQNIAWVTGEASGGVDGLGGTPARAGYTAGNGVDEFELPQSGDQSELLNLPTTVGNTDQPGIWEFQVHNGIVVLSPTLDPSTDSGIQGDDITDFVRPEIDGQGQAGDTVALFDATTPVGSGTVASNGTWQITTSSLALGRHSLTATETDGAGDVIGASSPLNLTIVAPPLAPSGLTLDPSTNSGPPGGNVTDVTQPEIDGQGQAGDTVNIYDNTTLVGGGTVGSDDAWQITTSALAAGQHSLTAAETDSAGDISPASSPLVVTIDTTPPPAPTGLTLDPSSAPGTVDDAVTADTTPRIDGEGVSGDTVTLYDLGAEVGTGIVGPGGDWSIVTSPLSAGGQAFTATQTDSAGDVSASSDPYDMTIAARSVGPGQVELRGADHALVIGADGNDLLGAAGADDTLVGGSGDDDITLIGEDGLIDPGAGSNTIFVFGGNDTVTGGGGQNQVYIDTNDVLTDGPLVFHDTVTSFNQPGGDRIHLTSDTATDALAHSTAANGGQDTLVTLSDGSTILLKGVGQIDSSFFA